jgi:uncharacterized protein
MHAIRHSPLPYKERIMSIKINWFEIPTTDFARAVAFYETVFDTTLKIEPFGGERLGVFVRPGGESTGCIIERKSHAPGSLGPLVYLDASPSIDAVLARIDAAGGSIHMPKTELPDAMGFIAHVDDCEGNRIALHATA